MYQTIKFGGKRISSSVDIVETVIFDYMSPHCDLQNSIPVFLHDTLAHNNASPYQVWLQKVQHLRRYRPDEHSLKFWTFPVSLTLTTTERSNFFHKTIQLMMVCHQTKFSCKRISSLEDVLESLTLIMWSLIVILTLKTANQSFWKTIWLMVIYHHNKSGSKRFSDSEDIVWTNTHCHFEILRWPWPRTQQIHSGLRYCSTIQSLVAKWSAVQRYSRTCRVLIIWALDVTLT